MGSSLKHKTHKELLELIDKVRQRIKKSDTVKGMFEEAGVDINLIDYIPMTFADLDVSARTDHGVIYFNYSLLNDDDFEFCIGRYEQKRNKSLEGNALKSLEKFWVQYSKRITSKIDKLNR